MKVPTNITALLACTAKANTNRPILEHVYLDRKDAGEPKLVATNGVCLAVVPLDGEFAEADTAGLVSPSAIKFLGKVKKWSAEDDARLNGNVSANGASVPRTLPGYEDGEENPYPSWRNVMPPKTEDVPEGGYRVSINASVLVMIAEAAKVGADKGADPIRVTLTFRNGHLAFLWETAHGTHGAAMPLPVR